MSYTSANFNHEIFAPKEQIYLSKGSSEKWISYSTCDEDSNSEIWALNIQPTDTVLSVTGSGCRSLSLLTRNPSHLISVDFSPAQNYLLELKLAAIRNLSYEKLLQFFGVEDSSDRWEIFCLLEGHLSAQTAAYFRANKWAIKRGILFTGQHELFYIRFTIPLMRLLFGRYINQIFNASTLEEQRLIYQNHVSSPLWKWLVRFGSSPFMFRYILNEPNLFTETDLDAGQYVLERLDHTFCHHLAKHNHWNSFMFYGKYLSRDCLPHFLQEENYLAIRKATTKIEIVTGDILEYIKQLPEEFVNKYSLSDVSSYMKKDKFESLLHEVVRTSKNKGCLCYRNFLSKWQIPSNLEDVMQRDREACSFLDWNDLAYVYSFEVATIK
jgi:S-adenosylmethionine-diacylglycerol 3-amino-3-carboxypropyl transferase